MYVHCEETKVGMGCIYTHNIAEYSNFVIPALLPNDAHDSDTVAQIAHIGKSKKKKINLDY